MIGIGSERSEVIKTLEEREKGAPAVAGLALSVALILLLAGLLWKGVASAQLSAGLFDYPFQFDESEGMIVAETMLLVEGVSIYEKPGPEMFIAAPYPPLFYLLAWPVQALVGEEPTFKIGRAFSIAATILSGLLIFGIISSVVRDRLAAALGALMWWSLGLVVFWGSLVKPDMLALTFGLGGLFIVSRKAKVESRKSGAQEVATRSRLSTTVWWSLPLFLAAFYTKQTAIAAGVALAAWLLVTRGRIGILFGAALLAGAALPTLILDLITGGGYWYHMYTVHDLPWFPGRFLGFLGGYLANYGVFLMPGVLALLWLGAGWLVARLRREAPSPEQHNGLLLCFYLGVTLVAATGTGTHGGNHNHLLELTAASCIGLGVGVGLLRRTSLWQARAAGALVALALLTQLPGLFATPRWLGLELRVPPAAYTEGMMNVFQYVTNNSGEAYSDNVGLLLLAGKRLWSTDPFTQTHATEFGRWDESALVEAIRSKRFSQIIFRIDVFAEDAGAGDVSPGILQAVRDNYKLDQRNVEHIYVPE